ncbi:peptidoglycan DD-metalloendopeptidase family protein [Marichromatium bheemlicum]|uniref:Peptidoglycan DD-metalloendopeptidase family protein n=2 Tax=Marichromatium bheemlicum TaxID=365339 RepID=A0ABX1I502_9GAMM|nr:peptidoglycan DD-metalloendopeptidase family protein [Marichromatium bheemlicum]NKN32649.1 peptidoglycan DD-metalloendopeptidase family protein [Marichromatium bheemlicum]
MADPDPVLDARQRDLVEIEREVERLGEALADQQRDRRELITALERHEREIAELVLAERELARQLALQRERAAALAERRAQARAGLDAELGDLAELVRTAHVVGRADRLRLLLNQEDPVRAGRVLSYFAYLNRDRVRRIEAVRGEIARLAALATAAAEQAARLAELVAAQRETRAQLETVQTEREAVLGALETAIAARRDDIAARRADAEALRRLIEHLRQRAAIQAELEIRRDPFAARKGRLIWPLLEGRVLARFGSRKADSELRWDGVLLAAEAGEEVRVVYDGRVVYADWLRGFGLLLVIEHGDGFMSLYGHNQALTKEVGEWVGAGEVVALSGTSGGRARPALYFAIRHDGKPQDPLQWCRRPAGRSGAHLATPSAPLAGNMAVSVSSKRAMASCPARGCREPLLMGAETCDPYAIRDVRGAPVGRRVAESIAREIPTS